MGERMGTSVSNAARNRTGQKHLNRGVDDTKEAQRRPSPFPDHEKATRKHLSFLSRKATMNGVA